MSEPLDPRLLALMDLAVATREKVDAGVYAVYLRHPAMQAVSTDDLLAACGRLQETAQWFPKLSELLTACKSTRAERIAAEERARTAKALADHPLVEVAPASPERVAAFKASVMRLVKQKAMR